MLISIMIIALKMVVTYWLLVTNIGIMYKMVAGGLLTHREEAVVLGVVIYISWNVVKWIIL